MGITVRIDGHSSDDDKQEMEEVKKLNLDVTTLMAYVSAQTNGSYDWEFIEPLLTEQAMKESKNHVKQFLEEIFEGNYLMKPTYLQPYQNQSFFFRKRTDCLRNGDEKFFRYR